MKTIVNLKQLDVLGFNSKMKIQKVIYMVYYAIIRSVYIIKQMFIQHRKQLMPLDFILTSPIGAQACPDMIHVREGGVTNRDI